MEMLLARVQLLVICWLEKEEMSEAGKGSHHGECWRGRQGWQSPWDHGTAIQCTREVHRMRLLLSELSWRQVGSLETIQRGADREGYLKLKMIYLGAREGGWTLAEVALRPSR